MLKVFLVYVVIDGKKTAGMKPARLRSRRNPAAGRGFYPKTRGA